MLYLIATPIGNLGDITLRAIETLKLCDYILCEDTRHSKILLSHYNIQKPLKSFHKFSESAKEKSILEDLLANKTIGLITDAGTPGISDPGTQLVQACIKEGISVSSIPGPCAAITALSCSGLDTDRFQFMGFLPRKTKELKSLLQEILAYPGTTVCYESPHRLLDSLEMLTQLSPESPVVIARELTKKFEEFQRGPAQELLEHFKSHPPKGEVILMLAGKKIEDASSWEHLSPLEHVDLLQKTYQLTKSEAIKMAASLRGVPKRSIYQQVIKET